MLHSDTRQLLASILSISICGHVCHVWRERTVINLTTAGGHQPPTGLSEQRAAAASTSANSLIRTAGSTFNDKGDVTVEERLSRNTEMQGLDLYLRGCEGEDLSLLLISQDTIFLMSYLTSLPETQAPASLNNLGFDLSSLPFYFLFKAWALMAANSGSWCLVYGESRWTNVTRIFWIQKWGTT